MPWRAPTLPHGSGNPQGTVDLRVLGTAQGDIKESPEFPNRATDPHHKISSIALNIAMMEKVGTIEDCPWLKKETRCPGFDWVHGHVNCTQSTAGDAVILNLANTAGVERTDAGNLCWRPRCWKCYLGSWAVRRWMMRDRFDDIGLPLCHHCNERAMLPYSTCKKHYGMYSPFACLSAFLSFQGLIFKRISCHERQSLATEQEARKSS